VTPITRQQLRGHWTKKAQIMLHFLCWQFYCHFTVRWRRQAGIYPAAGAPPLSASVAPERLVSIKLPIGSRRKN